MKILIFLISRITFYKNTICNQSCFYRNSDVNGRFRQYYFCLQLSCATSIRHDFRPSTHAQFTCTTSTMCQMNVVGLIYTTQSVVKHACRAQQTKANIVPSKSALRKTISAQGYGQVNVCATYIVRLAKSHDFVKGLTISYLAHTLRS